VWEGKKFDWADANKDGHVNIGEYFALHAPDLTDRAKDFQLMEADNYISQHDTDSSGTLSLEEMTKVLTDI
jgi:Ca2+-binding EF-hand superfamily protein